MSEHNVMRLLLTEIERDPSISQKRLSQEIGISVGMINWHVKRCVNKGLIKLKQAPARRYLYYLTPEGFSEKARLTASYLQVSFNLFQKGREQYNALLNQCQINGWRHIVLLGDTELTELALLVSTQFPSVHLLGIIDEASHHKNRAGVPIYASFDEFYVIAQKQKISAAIVCHYFWAAQASALAQNFQHLTGLDKSQFLIPEILQ